VFQDFLLYLKKGENKMGQHRKRKYRSRKQRTRQAAIRKACVWTGGILLLVVIVSVIFRAAATAGKEEEVETVRVIEERPDMEVDLLTVNDYSRPGIALNQVNAIVIHYTANPGSTAIQNRDYFEGLKDSHITKASSHFIIGTEGEIVQCIPTTEISYASNDRNSDSISIECCHLDSSGVFTEETYRSAVELTAWLCGKFSLTAKDVIRHYDVTGKNCPKYYVEHEDKWQEFLEDVDAYLQEHGTEEVVQ
jgi:N-acetyl-anhydromuramyl-L-alanine amidase AmpD